jgi:hypothetical protein
MKTTMLSLAAIVLFGLALGCQQPAASKSAAHKSFPPTYLRDGDFNSDAYTAL